MFETIAKDMALAMYASLVRGIILYHAFHLKLLTTYGAIANCTKVLPRGGQLAQAIALITEDDHKRKQPLTTAVVVNSKTGIPGSGFFEQCRQLGYNVGETEEEMLDFWYEQLFRLGVQPVTLEGFAPEPGQNEVRNLGTIEEVTTRARLAHKKRPRWIAMQQQLRDQVSPGPGPASQLPTG